MLDQSGSIKADGSEELYETIRSAWVAIFGHPQHSELHQNGI